MQELVIQFCDCSSSQWDLYLLDLPQPHFLQSSQWAQVKEKLGWKAFFKIWKTDENDIIAGALILERQIKIPFLPIRAAIQYIPKGPLVDWENKHLIVKVLADLQKFARDRKVIFVKIDPDVYIENPILTNTKGNYSMNSQNVLSAFSERSWRFSDSQVQFQNSMWIDLRLSDEQLLANMKQKTRYNVRLAQKKGIKIRVADTKEYPLLYQMYAQTSIRDQFVIRPASYYLDLWEKFSQAGYCEALLAEYEGLAVAGIMLYYFGNRAFYVYGMSTDQYRNFMPTYAIQWEAIKRSKEKGMKFYDLWGAPAEIIDSDPMYGVYRFKLGLGAELVKTIGGWDYISRPILFFLYEKIMPVILAVLRVIGRKKTEDSLQD